MYGLVYYYFVGLPTRCQRALFTQNEKTDTNGRIYTTNVIQSILVHTTECSTAVHKEKKIHVTFRGTKTDKFQQMTKYSCGLWYLYNKYSWCYDSSQQYSYSDTICTINTTAMLRIYYYAQHAGSGYAGNFQKGLLLFEFAFSKVF